MVIPVSKINPGKTTISFTWDDNSSRHYTIIGTLFKEYGLTCTFYVVPGTKDFESQHSANYADLHACGFEIGSHSYSHKYMTKLSESEAREEFINSINLIKEYTGEYPLTFAFPNHDYNDRLLKMAHIHHLETRNTLFNSVRKSIKKDSATSELINSVKAKILMQQNLVFSGHSIITDEEYQKGDSGEGYEPIRLSVLKELLSYLNEEKSQVEVINFSTAALRSYIISHGQIKEEKYILEAHHFEKLRTFNLTKDSILKML